LGQLYESSQKGCITLISHIEVKQVSTQEILLKATEDCNYHNYKHLTPLLLIHPDFSIATSDLDFTIPGKGLVHMYHLLARELFILPDKFEMCLRANNVIDTPFYTQARSKLVVSKEGKRVCTLGLQFAKISVPTYDGLVYQKLKTYDPSHVLVDNSRVDFHFLCAACNVEPFNVNTQQYAILFHLIQVEQQVLRCLSHDGMSEKAKKLVQLLLSGAWHISSNRLRLRYAEAQMMRTELGEAGDEGAGPVVVLLLLSGGGGVGRHARECSSSFRPIHRARAVGRARGSVVVCVKK
jgi:hypothetical protein